MGIIYVISVVSLLVIFMLIKKSDKKLNGLGMFGLGLVLLLCYNIFECYVLNFFSIKQSLLNLSIVNYVISIIGIVYLVRKREIQKYEVRQSDLIYSFLIGIATIVVGLLHYGYPLQINYETTDPAVHYRATQLFVENERLLNNIYDEIYDFRSFKIGSYVNSGIFTLIFANDKNDIENYKYFIIFDMFIIFLIAYMLYFTFIKISKGKMTFIAFAISLLCTFGYPLNSSFFGFEYLSVGLLFISAIINMVSYYKNKEIGIKQSVGIFFLLNFGLFCSYYLFVTFMYSALFIYFCIHHYKESKKIISKKLIIILLITLILPFILGFAYHLKPDLYSELNYINVDDMENLNRTDTPVAAVSGLVSEGYIYKNLYSNIILLLPLALYVLIRERKEFNFPLLMFIFLVGFLGLFFVGYYFGIVSQYYIGKIYFALWILLWYLNFKGLYYLYEKNIKIPYILLSIYMIIVIIFFSLFDLNKVKNTFRNLTNINVAEIYNINQLMVEANRDFYIPEIELLEYAKNNIDKNAKLEIIGSEQQILWAYPLLDRVTYYEEMEKVGHQDKLKYKYLNKEIIENADYVICFYRSVFYRDYDPEFFEGKDIIFQNGYGKIIKNSIY